jgi:hypothetical protein
MTFIGVKNYVRMYADYAASELVGAARAVAMDARHVAVKGFTQYESYRVLQEICLFLVFISHLRGI